MQNKWGLLTVCGMLLGFVFVSVSNAAAKDGRDFAGFYSLSNVTDLGEEVRVTLTVRVFNYSDADVSDAAITAEDSLLPETTYGTFEHVSIANRESVRLSADFTVPKHEYALWEKGATPCLRIQYTDAAGIAVVRGVELAPSVAAEEN